MAIDQQSPAGVAELNALARQNTAYAFGGGNVGGPNLWTWKKRVDPIMGRGVYTSTDPRTGRTKTVAPELVPVLSDAAKRAGVNVLPAGTGGKQEYAGLRSGMWVEAPETFRRGAGTSQRDSRDQFYSTATGRSMGTLMGKGSYEGFGKGGYGGLLSEMRAAKGKNPLGPSRSGYSGNVLGKSMGDIAFEEQKRKEKEQAENGGAVQAESLAELDKALKELETTISGLSGKNKSPEAQNIQPSTAPSATAPSAIYSKSGFAKQGRRNSPFRKTEFSSLTRFGGFGGVPMFPFSNY